MEKIYNDFRDMTVLQKAFSLLSEVYRIIKNFPSDERYALSDDLKRSSNSVVHNIAEEYGRFEPRDKTKFYKISRGGSYEAMSQIIVAQSQKYIDEIICEDMIGRYKEVINELNAIIHSLEKKKKLEVMVFPFSFASAFAL